MHWQGQTSRECIVHSVSYGYAIRTMFSPLCLSKQSVQRCQCRIGAMSYALRIRIMHHSAAPALGSAMSYALRIRIMHHSAAPARGRATSMDYALRIRITYQAPKARRRGLWATHYVSVLCIKRRKPAGEGYELRITYPYYASLSRACTWDGYGLRIMYPYHVSSAESPPERAMDYALRIRIMYQAPQPSAG